MLYPEGVFTDQVFAEILDLRRNARVLVLRAASPMPQSPLSASIRTNIQFVPAVLWTGVRIRRSLMLVIFISVLSRDGG